MQLTTILPVLLSTLSLTTAATQGAAPVFRSNNLDIGSSPGGVAWRFNVTARRGDDSPAFNTRCEGTSYNATPLPIQISSRSSPHWETPISTSRCSNTGSNMWIRNARTFGKKARPRSTRPVQASISSLTSSTEWRKDPV
ncbi:hypothetical protein N7481_011695 [Penicillium waksmanii]|uniref:uncharacterized protein n=1 Tax=Penicillium waksmanii TaxID=69791 RepID=UPI0025483BEF|nr:uncharacterized protein N7481_011695 [Penicillium waksmanii]KAJ5974485.1 hypothetical protein N7481_011695 [Penicillium waksmanii]